MKNIILLSLFVQLFSCVEKPNCFSHKDKLSQDELTKWLSFEGNIDSTSTDQIELYLSDYNYFNHRCKIRISLNSQYVYWEELGSKALILVPLPKKPSTTGHYLVGIEVINPIDSMYYQWSSDNTFFLSKGKRNYVEFLCGDEKETITLDIHQ